jgi:prepilin signal peptidase PulO-like enzyme (type II secretory pathway)
VLGPLDLIPFASWFLSRRRCRYCGAKLSLFYPLIELTAVLVAIWSATAATGLRFFASCALGWALLVVAGIAWHSGRRSVVGVVALLVWLAWLYLPFGLL